MNRYYKILIHMHIIKLKVWNLLSEIFPKFVGKDISIYIYVCVCVLYIYFGIADCFKCVFHEKNHLLKGV